MSDWDERKTQASRWFKDLRDQICVEFEAIEGELSGGNKADLEPGVFERSPWSREESDGPNESGSILKGGGEMSVMRGRVFEKVGVNISTVHGVFADEFAARVPGAQSASSRATMPAASRSVWAVATTVQSTAEKPRLARADSRKWREPAPAWRIAQR